MDDGRIGGPRAIVAVLAGGRGSRIGGAKACALLAGRPLIDYPLAAARAAQLEAVVVAKAGSELPHLEATVVEEAPSPIHPLCGILAALDFAHALDPRQAVLVLPCDMPFLPGSLLRRLAELEGAVVLGRAGSIEPLPARLMPAHREPLRRALGRESSLHRALGELSPGVLPERELTDLGDPAQLLFGINDRDGLARAEQMLAPIAGDDRPDAPAPAG